MISWLRMMENRAPYTGIIFVRCKDILDAFSHSIFTTLSTRFYYSLLQTREKQGSEKLGDVDEAKIWIQMFWLQVPAPRSGQHEPGCHIDWVKSWFWKFIISLIIHSVVSDFATPWTVACQPPLSVGFPRQEYWSGGWEGGGSGVQDGEHM